MQLIDGKKVSAEIRESLKEQIIALGTKNVPGLAVIIVGEDAASKVYVANKIKACEQVGIRSYNYQMKADVTNEELLALINNLNNDKNVNGILVQLPIPKHLDENKILDSISKEKDVDGFSPYQMGSLVLGRPELMPCTPSGIMELMKAYDIDISGKNAVIIGRSNIVGKPMMFMLLKEHATVTICHSRTQNLAELARSADILVVAIGRPNFVTKDMVKKGAVVIDVGINRVDGKLCGDVDFENVKELCSFITPVPGGVGPMTITMLLHNTIKAFELYGK